MPEDPHETVTVDMNVMNRTIHRAVGVRKVPVVRSVGGEWLLDTTPYNQLVREDLPARAGHPGRPGSGLRRCAVGRLRR